MKKEEFYLDQLLGRRVLAGNNRSVGRIEEFRTEQRGDYFEIVEVALGAAGLMERLNVGMRALFGLGARGKVARWEQIDFTDPERPRLTCSADELADITD